MISLLFGVKCVEKHIFDLTKSFVHVDVICGQEAGEEAKMLQL